MPEVAHLIKHATKRPNIRFVRVRLILKKFWRHIIWSSNTSICKIFGTVKYFRYTKIPQSNSPVLQKNILSFKVSMKNSPFVKIKKSKKHLRKPFHNHSFRKMSSFCILNFCVNVSSFTINHHNIKLLFSINKWVFESDYVSMSKFLK